MSAAPPLIVPRTTPTLDCFGLRRRGREQATHQDQFIVADMGKVLTLEHSSLDPGDDASLLFGGSQGKLLAVADGASGFAGCTASQEALRELLDYVLHVMPWFHRMERSMSPFVQEYLERALVACDREVNRAAPMGIDWSQETTLTLACLLWPRLYGAHAGNSRGYLLRDGVLRQFTRDQTVAQSLIAAGTITPDDAAGSPVEGVLYSAVGGGREAPLRADGFTFDLRHGDVVMLCTDGLTDQVSEEGLAAFLSQARTAEKACRKLVAAASFAGGEDDTTVVVATVGDPHARRAR